MLLQRALSTLRNYLIIREIEKVHKRNRPFCVLLRISTRFYSISYFGYSSTMFLKFFQYVFLYASSVPLGIYRIALLYVSLSKE